MERVRFKPEGEDRPVDFFVLEETRLAGKQYLLVTDSEDGDGDALILRTDDVPAVGGTGSAEPAADTETGEASYEEASYEIVEDEAELSAVLLLMRDSLEELGIEIEE